MEKNLRDKNTDMFFNAILHLESVDECYDFFEDLCTVNELKSISLMKQVQARQQSAVLTVHCSTDAADTTSFSTE